MCEVLRRGQKLFCMRACTLSIICRQEGGQDLYHVELQAAHGLAPVFGCVPRQHEAARHVAQ